MIKAGIFGGAGTTGHLGDLGQAVQNMNILFGLPGTTGLEQVPVVP